MSIVISLPAPLWGCSPSTSIPVCIIYGWLCIMLKGFCRGEVVRCTHMWVAHRCKWPGDGIAMQHESRSKLGTCSGFYSLLPRVGAELHAPCWPPEPVPCTSDCLSHLLPIPSCWAMAVFARENSSFVLVNFSVLKFMIAKHFNW